MKITRKDLRRLIEKTLSRRIIREEKQKLLKEAGMVPGLEKPEKNISGWNGEYGGSTYEGTDIMKLVSDRFDRMGVTAPRDFWDLLESYINDVEDAAKEMK